MKRTLPLLLPALAAGLVATGTAYAEGASAKGAQGQTLTVSSAKLAEGDTITVTGSGFDETKGIYVGLCRDLGPDRLPSPCGGGADTEGTGGGSQWISSNPPPYGRTLAIPYGEGGTFEVKLTVTQKVGDFDCAEVKCSVVTRADHTRASDRSQDVRVPVEFGGSGSGPAVVGGAAAAVVVLGAGGFLLARRRKAKS